MQKILQDKSLGDNLLRLRKERGFTQVEVVAKMQLLGSNMSRSSYVKIEKGYRNIFVSDLIILKKIYNVSFDEFFHGL